MRQEQAQAGRITLRFADPAHDASAILALYAPYIEQTAITFEQTVPSLEAFTTRVREIASAFPYLLLEVDGALVGYAYAHRQAERAAFGWNAELSIYLAPACVGQGLGKPLYALLMELLAAQGYVNFYAVITGDNARSIAMHEAMGFVRCGLHTRTGYKFGRWHDVVWLVRALPVDAPAPIQSVDALDATTVRQALQRAAVRIQARCVQGSAEHPMDEANGG